MTLEEGDQGHDANFNMTFESCILGLELDCTPATVFYSPGKIFAMTLMGGGGRLNIIMMLIFPEMVWKCSLT
jgi:hypothetical protein